MPQTRMTGNGRLCSDVCECVGKCVNDAMCENGRGPPGGSAGPAHRCSNVPRASGPVAGCVATDRQVCFQGGGGGRLAPPGRTWRFLTQSCLMLPQPLKTKSSQELYVLTLVQSLLFFMVSSTWLSEELTVSVAVQCMSGRVSKQNITLDSDTEWFG